MATRFLACMLVLAAVTSAWSADTARQILDRRKALDDTTRHWDDRHQRMKLTIIDRRGGERLRELEVFAPRYPTDEQKAILFSLAPAEVKGTAFLSYTHKGRPADQWLYLPELKRVRQITSRARSESFVGTDLSYHDLDLLQEMISWTEDDAASSLRGEETIDGTASNVIELTPKREDIGYKRIVIWLGKDDFVPPRLEFYDGETDPKKRITQTKIDNVGVIPVPHAIEVASPGAGSRTVIEITDVRFNQGLKEDQFSQRYLEQGGL